MGFLGSFAGASARAYGLGAGLGAPGDYESIATITVGSGGQATIEFTSIPSNYTHLQLRGRLRRTSGSYDVDTFQFNNDTATNYSWHNFYTDGISLGANGAANASVCYGLVTPGSSQQANAFNGFVLDILDYTNSNKYKTARSFSGLDDVGAGYPWMSSSNWRSTSTITSVKFIPASGSYAQHSSIALYGVKA